MPPFILDVYDKDALSEDFIGRCVIPLSSANHSSDDTINEPAWFACRVRPSAPAQGEILVSIQVNIFDYDFKVPVNRIRLQDTVETKEFQVDINFLGLRDLQSVGILPVKKAFVVFNLKSLVSPDDGRALENVRTQPGPTGANPTINSLISFKLPLPTSALFCPKLVCTVYDYIFVGMNQPLIGSFTIPIGKLIFDLKNERKEETAAIRHINDELEKIIREEGIVTYNIQNLTEREIMSESPPRTSLFARNSKVIERMNVDEEMKQPLLLQEDRPLSKILGAERTSRDASKSDALLPPRVRANTNNRIS